MRVRCSNKQLENVLNQILEMLESVGAKASRGIETGPGVRIAHTDSESIVLEASGSGSGDGAVSCRKWVPVPSSVRGQPSLTWRDGTINGVVASNIHVPVKVTPAPISYILAKCEAASGGKLKFTIGITTENLANMADAENTPPSPFYVLLGTIYGGKVTMLVCRNLSVTAEETRRSAKRPAALGDEPFTRWYRWQTLELEDF